MSETKGLALSTSGTGKSCPPPLQFTTAPAASPGEPVTPTSKLGRRSFWDMLVTLLRDWWGAEPAAPHGILGQEGQRRDLAGVGRPGLVTRVFEIRATAGLWICRALTLHRFFVEQGRVFRAGQPQDY